MTIFWNLVYFSFKQMEYVCPFLYFVVQSGWKAWFKNFAPQGDTFPQELEHNEALDRGMVQASFEKASWWWIIGLYDIGRHQSVSCTIDHFWGVVFIKVCTVKSSNNHLIDTFFLGLCRKNVLIDTIAIRKIDLRTVFDWDLCSNITKWYFFRLNSNY